MTYGGWPEKGCYSQRYDVTPYGWKVARLYARLEARIFRPALTAMNGPPAPCPANSGKP